MMSLRKHIQRLFRTLFHKPSRTVRFAFPMVFASAIVLMANVIAQDGTAEVLLEVTPTQVEMGEEAYLDVKVKTTTAINALTIIISAPKDTVLLETVEVSDSVITLWTEEPQVVDDTIILRGGTFRRGFVGEHVVARIPFTPATSGMFRFTADDIELVAGDGDGTVIRPELSTVRSDTVYALAEGATPSAPTADSAIERSIREQLGIGEQAIGLRDISRFMSAWTSRSTTYDFDGDDAMTFRDFAILLAYSFGI